MITIDIIWPLEVWLLGEGWRTSAKISKVGFRFSDGDLTAKYHSPSGSKQQPWLSWFWDVQAQGLAVARPGFF